MSVLGLHRFATHRTVHVMILLSGDLGESDPVARRPQRRGVPLCLKSHVCCVLNDGIEPPSPGCKPSANPLS